MYKQITAPDAGYQFHRWQGLVPPLSKAETRLAELRRHHGNVEGTRIFRNLIRCGQVRI